MSRPIPMIDDIALDSVTYACHKTTGRLSSVPVVGLQGDVQQQLGRGSHEIEIHGILVGEEAFDALSRLQEKTATGEEVVFHSDITTALELEKVVVVEARFSESAGRPHRYQYQLVLRESPPLPEPAQLSPFGGLDGFDLGFDTDILDDILDAAGDLQDAIDMVNDVVGELEMLSNLSSLAVGNPLEPIQAKTSEIGALGQGAEAAGSVLGDLLEGE